MSQQLNYARTQFEHYQEATARQRSEDRQASDQRITRLEQDLANAHRRLADAQALIAQQKAQRNLNIINTERDQLVYQVEELSEVRIDLDKKLKSTQDPLTDARVAVATTKKDVDM